jgi:hypothetical protein
VDQGDVGIIRSLAHTNLTAEAVAHQSVLMNRKQRRAAAKLGQTSSNRLGETTAAVLVLRGNRLLFGDQEAVGCDEHRGVVVETAPASALEVAEAEFLLESW